MIQTQFQTNIKVLKANNARDFLNSALGTYLQSHGKVHQSSCVDTPQKNGVVERKNRHLHDVARSLMLTSQVPKHFWGEVVLIATYLINQLPSWILKFNTPLHSLLTLYPTSHLVSPLPLKIFGCTAFVHTYSQNCSKLDARSLKCIFLGYSPNKKGYKCYHPPTYQFFHTKDVTFFENQS